MKRMLASRRAWTIFGFLTVFSVFATGFGSAQTTSETISKENPPAAPGTTDAAKAPPATHRSFLDRVRDWAESAGGESDESTGGDARRGFYPRFGGVSTRSVVGIGGGYRDNRLFGSPVGLDASALFSSRRARGYQLLVGLLDRRPGNVALAPADARPTSMFEEGDGTATAGFAVYGDFRYRNFARPFYRNGADNASQDRSDLLLDGTSYDLVTQYVPARVFGLTARAGLLDLTTAAAPESPASIESPLDPPALSERSRFLVAGAGAALDTRSSKSDPHDGVFAGFALWRFNARSGEASDFTRFTLDARSYWTPFCRRGVVATRFLLSADSAAPGGQVSFYLQQGLGGSETLRGFGVDRFRDLALGYATAEYRFEVNRFLDVGPFVDVGTVGAALSRLALGSLSKTYGLRAGVRSRSRVLLHVDLGRTPAGYRLTAGTGVLF